MSEPASDRPDAKAEAARLRLWLLLPLLGFLALAALFFFRLGSGDPSRIPSALLNKPVPEFTLPPVVEGQGQGLSTADLAKGVHVVNVWASWCGPCRAEHPILMRLSADPRIQIVGIDYKDVPENAVRFLGALGNPFKRVGADQEGRTAIDWGVYGVPETFIVKDGVIVHKFIGPLSEQGLATEFAPALERALAGSS
jgi:cytochrome c biogenesis protein CcmG/thiol:disulfide interchange protein DsbE